MGRLGRVPRGAKLPRVQFEHTPHVADATERPDFRTINRVYEPRPGSKQIL